jgi:hypothetical protein
MSVSYIGNGSFMAENGEPAVGGYRASCVSAKISGFYQPAINMKAAKYQPKAIVSGWPSAARGTGENRQLRHRSSTGVSVIEIWQRNINNRT